MEIWRKILNFKSEKGQGFVEYGLILAVISIVAYTALTGLLNSFFSKIWTEITARLLSVAAWI